METLDHLTKPAGVNVNQHPFALTQHWQCSVCGQLTLPSIIEPTKGGEKLPQKLS